jgi:hypothetical protein
VWKAVAQPVFADPKTDVVFTRIFATKHASPSSIALLNDLLELKGTRRIQSVQHFSLEQHVRGRTPKHSLISGPYFFDQWPLLLS